jgi:site-specific DNA-methyltransferase (cytosine-N4-specific)
LWVVLAETARLCSNSRLTTVKLHIRKADDLKRSLLPIDIFDQVAAVNLAGLEAWCLDLAERGMLRPGNWLTPSVQLLQGDVRTDCTFAGAMGHECGLVLTSPPYGDNRSTIPYGEASYLPTQWIDPEDLGLDAPPKNAFVVDAESLGGSRVGALKAADGLASRSSAFAEVASALRSQPADRLKRVAGFVRDLDEAIEKIHHRLARDAWQVWTVGSRTVGGVQVPLAAILTELQSERGVHHVATLTRPLPSQRRAAARNDRAPRMTEEQVVVLHNGSG